MNLFRKQKQTHRHRKQTYGCQRGKGGEINQEFGINIHTLLQETDKQQGTGNYIQYLVITSTGKESGKEYILYV